MKVSDRFPNKLSTLQLFGFKGDMLQQALWRIPDSPDRFLWFAYRTEYAGGVNRLSEDGLIFDDRRDPKLAGANTYGTHDNTKAERILFLKTRIYGKETFVFEGVFKPDLERSKLNLSAWKRVSVECFPPDGSWQQS